MERLEPGAYSPYLPGGRGSGGVSSKKRQGLERRYKVSHFGHIAGDRMANTSDSISEIAQSLGYESASAFTKAFKKVMG
jgi:hypothetical protein